MSFGNKRPNGLSLHVLKWTILFGRTLSKIFNFLPPRSVIISATARLSRKKLGGTLMYELKIIIRAVNRFPKNPTTNKTA